MAERRITETEALGLQNKSFSIYGEKLLTESEFFNRIRDNRQVRPIQINEEKLYNDIRNTELGNEENAKQLSNLYLANKLKLDPRKSSYDSLVRTYMGLKKNESTPDVEKIFETIKNSIDPRDSNDEWQNHEKFLEVAKNYEEGQKVKLEPGILGKAANLLLPESMEFKGEQEDAYLNAFKNDRIVQLQLGREILSEDMQKFAFNRMVTKRFNNRDYQRFLRFEEKEKQYFFTYLKALNPKQDLDFLNEVGERLALSGYDAWESMFATGRTLKRMTEGVNNAETLYAMTKDAETYEERLNIVMKDIELRRARGRSLQVGLSNQILPEFEKGLPTTREAAEEFMKTFDQRFEEGKTLYDRRQATRAFERTIRKS